MTGFSTLGRSGVEKWESHITGKLLHIIDTPVLHYKEMKGGCHRSFTSQNNGSRISLE